MNLDNSVRDGRGAVIGFRCIRCDKVKSQMWGDTCNRCRENKEAVEALAKVARLEAENAILKRQLSRAEGR